MLEAGMNVARINLSYGNFDDHRAVVEAIRRIGEASVPVDLPGPKIRIGEVEGSGGCRYTAYVMKGDWLADDPSCRARVGFEAHSL